jgi:hypothetical protein
MPDSIVPQCWQTTGSLDWLDDLDIDPPSFRPPSFGVGEGFRTAGDAPDESCVVGSLSRPSTDLPWHIKSKDLTYRNRFRLDSSDGYSLSLDSYTGSRCHPKSMDSSGPVAKGPALADGQPDPEYIRA